MMVSLLAKIIMLLLMMAAVIATWKEVGNALKDMQVLQ